MKGLAGMPGSGVSYLLSNFTCRLASAVCGGETELLKPMKYSLLEEGVLLELRFGGFE